jgi:hypothetical protein
MSLPARRGHLTARSFAAGDGFSTADGSGPRVEAQVLGEEVRMRESDEARLRLHSMCENPISVSAAQKTEGVCRGATKIEGRRGWQPRSWAACCGGQASRF